jgi:hypothetical protein
LNAAIALAMLVLLSACDSAKTQGGSIASKVTFSKHFTSYVYEGDSRLNLLGLTLYDNGQAMLTNSLLSSTVPPPCVYKIINSTLTLYAKFDTKRDESAYGVKNGGVVGTFLIETDGNAIVFQSGIESIYVSKGDRYIKQIDTIPLRTYPYTEKTT